MTAFTFNSGIPATNNNPSVDQPDMQTNNVSTEAILNVDHVTFNTAGPAGPGTPGASGGQHLQVTFNGKNVPAGAPTDPISILYSNSGTASAISEIFYRNQNAILPVSALKAFGVFTCSNVAPPLDNSFNCTVAGSGTSYTITLGANVVTGNNIIIIASISNSLATFSYTFTNPNIVFTTNLAAPGFNAILSFLVIQA